MLIILNTMYQYNLCPMPVVQQSLIQLKLHYWGFNFTNQRVNVQFSYFKQFLSKGGLGGELIKIEGEKNRVKPLVNVIITKIPKLPT